MDNLITMPQLAYLQEKARASRLEEDWIAFNKAANEYNRQCLKEAQAKAAQRRMFPFNASQP
jgi:hypothetical protein